MDIKSLYIRGWKELAEVTGFHERTLRDWHYVRCRLKFTKLNPHSKNSRWIASVSQVMRWLHVMGVININNTDPTTDPK